ncbi:MAG: heme NO-binding domain-containing protein [Acidobacteriota bacterium]
MMKGIVFTEFIEMVESQYSPLIADKIITASELKSGGAYTAVGTYDYQEMLQLVNELSKASGVAVADLLRRFGERLFHTFVRNYSQYLNGAHSTFEFLRQVDHHIHAEVRKVYPDVELPQLECELKDNRLEIVYKSIRAMADLAEGLINACIQYFHEDIQVIKKDLSGGIGVKVKFILIKRR